MSMRNNQTTPIDRATQERGLQWWFEPASDRTWCSCCAHKGHAIAHVGSTREGANVGLCIDCIEALAKTYKLGPTASSRDKPFKALGKVPTSTRVEEQTMADVAVGEGDLGAMMKAATRPLRKRSERGKR